MRQHIKDAIERETDKLDNWLCGLMEPLGDRTAEVAIVVAIILLVSTIEMLTRR